MEKKKTYIAIDLKSFYASVECVEAGLNPLDVCLLVADQSRTKKTICLAVSPALKQLGCPGRPRLFEAQKVIRELNHERRMKTKTKRYSKKSVYLHEIEKDNSVQIDYLVATPRMATYMAYSIKIYNIYMKYFSKDDMHVYSVDEVFIDATQYLDMYKITAHELARRVITDILSATGITATAGIGPNMFLCKVAMDIVAKHIPADKDGVRIAEIDEMSYREKLWDHLPLTDFWRIGPGYTNRLALHGLYTMGDVAMQSVIDEDVLYDEFGINAELLIDHAWGWEPVEMKDIKGYKTTRKSLGEGQVLAKAYTYEEAKTICKEMVENLSMDLIDKGLVSDNFTLGIKYDSSNQIISGDAKAKDHYGRTAPKPLNTTIRTNMPTASLTVMMKAYMDCFEEKVEQGYTIRAVNVAANTVMPKGTEPEKKSKQQKQFEKEASTEEKEALAQTEEKDEKVARALLEIKKKYGKNSILRGTNFMEGSTGRERNKQIGGHKG